MVNITVVGDGETVSCISMVSVFLINDNPPVVDLSGAGSTSINYTVALNYNFTRQASIPIASSEASITDADTNSPLRSLDVQLVPGYPNDGIFLGRRVGCPRDNSSTCHIR